MKHENVYWILKILKLELLNPKKFVQILILEISIINRSTIQK